MSGNFDNANGAPFSPLELFVMELFRVISPNGGSISAIQDARTSAYGASPQQRFGFPIERHSYISTPHTSTSLDPVHWKDPNAFDPSSILAFLTALRLLSLQSGWPVLSTIVVLTVLFSVLDWNDNHVLRTLDTSEPPQPQNILSAFDGWVTAREKDIEAYTKENRPYPVFVFVAEGGGIRAASMTAQVMELLRKGCPDAIRHTFLSIGVSGGSLGEVLATAAMKRNALGTGCEGKIDQVVDTDATSALREDHLKSLVRGMLFADLPVQFLPASLAPTTFAAISDRAQYFENGLSSAWRRSTKGPDGTSADLDSVSFGSLWDGPSGPIPALMLLATDVNSGRRVAASHVLMPPARPTGTPCEKLFDPNTTDDLADRTRVIALSEFMEKDLRATTAALVSARFPGITPAASVYCSDVKRRLVDGGYFENSGLTTAADVMRLILPKIAPAHLSLYIVSVENSEASAPESAESYFSELLSPFRAMEGARAAHAEMARASWTSTTKIVVPVSVMS